jgi:hypothetical protein
MANQARSDLCQASLVLILSWLWQQPPNVSFGYHKLFQFQVDKRRIYQSHFARLKQGLLLSVCCVFAVTMLPMPFFYR